LLLAYATMRAPLPGMALLFLIGLVQSFCMVPMSVLLLRVSQPAFRGRVMGVRILAVYGMAIGLPVAGLLVARIGFAATAALFAAGGLLWTVAILVRWRADLWRPDAPANLRSRP
jgi:predicted MFS family arabinose efflux permease